MGFSKLTVNTLWIREVSTLGLKKTFFDNLEIKNSGKQNRCKGTNYQSFIRPDGFETTPFPNLD